MRTETNFSDRTIFCENRHVIGFERLDRQILVIGETAIFNFCRLRCMRDGCFSVVEWVAPTLKPDDIYSVNDIPRPKQNSAAMAESLGYIKKTLDEVPAS